MILPCQAKTPTRRTAAPHADAAPLAHVACLHTAGSNIAIFEAAATRLGGVRLSHAVRADLLAAAECAGALTSDVAGQTVSALLDLCADADAVLLTCSTLGPAVNGIEGAVPVLRVDAALARAAACSAGTLVVLCAAPTTLLPTRALFEAAACDSGTRIDVRLVPGAWALFRDGQQSAYLRAIAGAAQAALRDGAGQVALAQASMAEAVQLAATDPPPLASPDIGLAAALAAVRRHQPKLRSPRA